VRSAQLDKHATLMKRDPTVKPLTKEAAFVLAVGSREGREALASAVPVRLGSFVQIWPAQSLLLPSLQVTAIADHPPG
jgi:hypothetical protein